MYFIPKELADKLQKKSYPMPTNIVYATFKKDGKLCPMKIVGEVICKEPIAPTIEQVLEWLRKEKGIFVEISPAYIDITFYASVYKREDGKHLRCNISLKYNSYEKAALAGIEYVLDNLI